MAKLKEGSTILKATGEELIATNEETEAKLADKVDKVVGKQLSTEDYTTAEKNKLAGIDAGANKYVHPATHPATIIVEDSTHRFVTDAQISNWNSGIGGGGTGDGDMKKAVYDTDGDGIVDNAEKLEGHPASDFQPAGSYAPSSHTHDDRYYTETEIDTKFSNLDIGNGDMKKSVYDTDGDGVVDEAASVPWTGVNGTDNVITTSDASNGVPKIDGTAASGTSRYYSRADHVHPTDTTRAPIASPTFTGTPKAPTATAGTNTTQIATTAFVVTAINNAIGDINTLLDSINGEVI